MQGRARQGSAPTTADPAERAREIALRLLTHSPRSAAQLREGLLARGVEEPVADEVVARYREVGLLDDAGLAAQLARTRHSERGQARRAIAQELRRKGFETADAEAALAQITDEDEKDAAFALASRRWRQLTALDPQARARRIVGMLGRKGYSPGIAYGVLKRLETQEIWETDGELPLED